MKQMPLLLFALLLSPLGVSQTSPDQQASSAGDETTIVSLLLRNDAGHYTGSLLQSIVADGIKSRTDIVRQPWREGDWLCLLEKQDGSITDTLQIVQPLRLRYEYPDDHGAIGSAVLTLQENSVWLQFPYHPDIQKLRLFHIGLDNRPQMISILSLPEKN